MLVRIIVAVTFVLECLVVLTNFIFDFKKLYCTTVEEPSKLNNVFAMTLRLTQGGTYLTVLLSSLSQSARETHIQNILYNHASRICENATFSTQFSVKCFYLIMILHVC